MGGWQAGVATLRRTLVAEPAVETEFARMVPVTELDRLRQGGALASHERSEGQQKGDGQGRHDERGHAEKSRTEGRIG